MMRCPTFTAAQDECAEGEVGGAKDGDELGGSSSRAERACAGVDAVRRQGPLSSRIHVTSPRIHVNRARTLRV